MTEKMMLKARAEEIVNYLTIREDPENYPEPIEEIVLKCLRAAVEQAKAEEREACARIADGHDFNEGTDDPDLDSGNRKYLLCARQIAAAIRARK